MDSVNDSQGDILQEIVVTLGKLRPETLKNWLAQSLIAPELITERLLAGLTEGTPYTQISKRLRDDREAKRNLADYLVTLAKREAEDQVTLAKREAEDQDVPYRLFIESGSTLAFFAARLGDPSGAGMDVAPEALSTPIHVVTNNFLALTALGVGKVEVTPGSLESSYLAFLPFQDCRRAGHPSQGGGDRRRTQITDMIRGRDRRAFVQLLSVLDEVDSIYMTASGFGFLLGPHVGSRANAIFKYCLLNNRARRPIRICIAARKLHVSPDNGKVAGEPDPVKTCEQMVERECYTVFNLGSCPNTPLGIHLADRNCVTGSVSDLECDADPTSAGAISAPTELGLSVSRATKTLCEGEGLVGLSNTWRDLLAMYPAGKIELIIGLQSALDASKPVITEAVVEANKILAEWNVGRQYQLLGGTPPSVLHYKVVSADGHAL